MNLCQPPLIPMKSPNLSVFSMIPPPNPGSLPPTPRHKKRSGDQTAGFSHVQDRHLGSSEDESGRPLLEDELVGQGPMKFTSKLLVDQRVTIGSCCLLGFFQHVRCVPP